MAIKDVMEAIKNSLQSLNLIDSNSISFSANPLTFEGLKSHVSNKPQIFIHCSSFGDSVQEENAGLVDYDLITYVQFSVSILSENTGNNVSNDLTARLLSEAVLLHLIEQDWGLENCLPAANRLSKSLYPSLESTAQNCNIWLVSWTQIVGLNKNGVQSDIADWLSYHADHHNSTNTEQILASSDVDMHSS